MMCHRIGLPPISTMGLGRLSLASRMRVPWPPHRMTTGMLRSTRSSSVDDAHVRVKRSGLLTGIEYCETGEPAVERLLGQPPRPVLPRQLRRTVRDGPRRLEPQLLARPGE